MSSIPGSIPVTGIIAPTSTTDIYAVTDAIYGLDGLRNVDTYADRDNIPVARRREGMIVGVIEDSTYWRLLASTGSNIWNVGSSSNWEPFQVGGSGVVNFEDSDTIAFTQSGDTYSAFIKPDSITVSSLKTEQGFGATAGYILSNDGLGNFQWVEKPSSGTTLAVSDYETGITFSNVENIIFRGGLVSTPTGGGTALGVLATGPTPTVTVWIPAPPQAVYASHFNTTDGNTNGIVNRTLSTATVRISSPNSEGNPFETGSWAGQNQPATIVATPVISTFGLVTGFSEDSNGDSKVTVTVFKADGVSTFSVYTTPVLYQNGTHTDSAGITVNIADYSPDDSGFPAIYTTKYKASVSVSVNMSTIFIANNLDGGRYKIRVQHFTDTETDGGFTYSYDTSDVFYDTNLLTPSISGTTTIIESTNSSNIVTKHISGVEYYTTGSQFEITTTGIDNLNQNTQGFNNGTSKNFTITAAKYNLPTRNLEAWSPFVGTFIGWSNIYTLTGVTFSYNNWAISNSTTYRYRGEAAVATSQVFDPWNVGGEKQTTNASILIDQVTDNSSRLGESFNGESERLIRESSNYSTWNSTTSLGTSISNQTGTGPFCDACIVGGQLVRPDRYFLTDPNVNTIQPNLTTFKPNKGGDNPNYSSHNQIATYHRKFYTNSTLNIASFQMSFSGSFGTSNNAITALSSSLLKVYIRRVDCVTGGSFGFNANPLSLHGGLYNFNSFNDGVNGIDTPGSLIRTGGSNNSVNATFGTFAAKTGFWMELQIVDPNIRIDTINVTLTFANNTTDSAPVT